MSALDNMTEEQLEAIFAEVKALKRALTARGYTIVDLERRLGLSRDSLEETITNLKVSFRLRNDSLEKVVADLKKETLKNIISENACVAFKARDVIKVAEEQRLIKENRGLRAGASAFSKALQVIGLDLVQMGVEVRQSLPEIRNDGKK